MNDEKPNYVANQRSIFGGKEWGVINGKVRYYRMMFALTEFLRSTGYFRHPKLIAKLQIKEGVLRFRVGTVAGLSFDLQIETLKIYDSLVSQLMETLGQPQWVEKPGEHLEWTVEATKSEYVYSFLKQVAPANQIDYFAKTPDAWLIVGLTNLWGVTYAAAPATSVNSGVYRGTRLGKRIEGNWPAVPSLELGNLLQPSEVDGSAIQAAYAKAVEQTTRELDAKIVGSTLSPLAQQMAKLEEMWHSEVEAKIEARVAEEVRRALDEKAKAEARSALLGAFPFTPSQAAKLMGISIDEHAAMIALGLEHSGESNNEPKGREAWKVVHHTAMGNTRPTQFTKVGGLTVDSSGRVAGIADIGNSYSTVLDANLGDLIQAYLEQKGTNDQGISTSDGKIIYLIRGVGESKGKVIEGLSVSGGGIISYAGRNLSIDALVATYFQQGGKLQFGRLQIGRNIEADRVTACVVDNKGNIFELGANDAGEAWSRWTKAGFNPDSFPIGDNVTDVSKPIGLFEQRQMAEKAISELLNMRDGKHIVIRDLERREVLQLWRSQSGDWTVQATDGRSKCVQMTRTLLGEISTHNGGWSPNRQ